MKYMKQIKIPKLKEQEDLPITIDGELRTLKTLPQLNGESFRHADDIKSSETLLGMPFIPEVMSAIHKFLSHKTFEITLLTCCLKISEKQGPHLYELYTAAAKILGIDNPPDLYLTSDSGIAPNACAYGLGPYFIIFNANFLMQFNEAETMAILGHELGHVKCNHMVAQTVANFLFGMGGSLLSSFVPVLGTAAAKGMSQAAAYWSRCAEFTSDRAGLLVVQEPEIYAKAMAKLLGYKSRFLGEINFDAVIDQINQFEECDENVMDSLRKMMFQSNIATSSHPLTAYRVVKALQWGSSDQFNDILKGEYVRELA